MALGVGAAGRRPVQSPVRGRADRRRSAPRRSPSRAEQQVDGDRAAPSPVRGPSRLVEPAQPLLDHRPGDRGGAVAAAGRSRLRTRSASGASRRRSPNAAQRTDSTRAPVCAGVPAGADVVAGGEPLDLGGEPGLADAGLGGHHQDPRLAPVDRPRRAGRRPGPARSPGRRTAPRRRGRTGCPARRAGRAARTPRPARACP